MGKLGLPLALLYAQAGYRVIGHDVVKATIQRLRSGKSPITEEGVQKLLSENKKMISFTTQIAEITKSDVTFVVVPTPSSKDGSFSSVYIEQALSSLCPIVKKKKSRHTIIITSTISPGTMDKVIKPLVERLTKKKVGIDLGLCYSPELIALGSVVQNMQLPDFLFIGESDKKTGAHVAEIRKRICKNSPPVVRTNWINTEIAKLSLNAYITSKISFANMVARICEHTPLADSEVVLQTIGLDSRIGTKYLKGGLGYGGPCFPRDTLSLAATIRKAGLDIQLPQVTHDFNQQQAHYLFDIVKKLVKKTSTVGILGLGYKQGTDVIEESQGMILLGLILASSMDVVAYDPLAMQNAQKSAPTARFARSVDACVKMSDIIILTTPWDDFKKIRWDQYRNKTVIDCWRMIDVTKQDKSHNTFIQLGTHLSIL